MLTEQLQERIEELVQVRATAVEQAQSSVRQLSQQNKELEAWKEQYQ